MWDTIIINPMTNLLLWIYDILGHGPHMFGLAIILFTILIKVITWPLNASQVKGAQAMQELQNDKEWQEIQKKYAKDKERIAQEQMRIYKERGINPFASCLPTLIQFPIIIGLYQSITHALSVTPFDMLKLARAIYPFQNVEGIIPLNSTFLWMDLGRPESVQILGFALPTLAVVVALTTYVQSKLTMPTSTNPNDQSAQMTGMMSIYMPLLLGWFALNFASGIAVYFITSNLLGIIQYAATGRANWSNLLPGGNKKSSTKK
ncbi:MAG: membrane protein insertase YidC [Anaerolineales bacterium]|uniref:YidC/Oxa1 family membrane protein insertase n=1 Tax=Candidatus Villigracilis proximus TaxID=3140683 RepID=UPI0031360C0B|nr:membrane protein insertase YidC [Anaerolineales bacterium]MBK8823742.1 membrane protein insertase YidC [Anaerolineales bacterium]MBK9208745.1 membrane protein insertase YidC [Anaerolineales bacterium]